MTTSAPAQAPPPRASRGRWRARWARPSPERPVRVVALGATDADGAVALGVVPVAIPSLAGVGVPAWLLERLTGERPEVLNVDGDLPVERVAALNPDVILATISTAWSGTTSG